MMKLWKEIDICNKISNNHVGDNANYYNRTDNDDQNDDKNNEKKWRLQYYNQPRYSKYSSSLKYNISQVFKIHKTEIDNISKLLNYEMIKILKAREST